MNEKKIDFLGIGAAKSGSSWISYLLQQHPSVDIPVRKELCYFNRHDVSGILNQNYDQPVDYYLRFWDFEKDVRRGEFSPQYLSDAEAPKRVKSLFPDIKLMVILRNPSYRALSHFEYDQYFNGTIPKNITFEAAAQQFPHLLEAGHYHKHLIRWFDLFRREQFKILIFEEAIRHQEKTAKEIFSFLRLQIPGQLDYSPVNEQREIRSAFVAKLLKIPGKVDKKLGRSLRWSKAKQSAAYNALVDAKNKMLDINARKRKTRSSFPAATYRMLEATYQKEISDLEALLDINLDCWRSEQES